MAGMKAELEAGGGEGGAEGAVCETCLAHGRRVARLQRLRPVFLAVLSDQYAPRTEAEVDGMRVCWECRAVLRRTLQFRQRAGRAQEWLQWARGRRGGKLDQQEISTLTSVTKLQHDYDMDYVMQTVTKVYDAQALPIKRDFTKWECASASDGELPYGAAGDYDEQPIKLEPMEETIFVELPIVVQSKKDRKRAPVKVEVRRKKRARASLFNAYRVISVSAAEVARQREEEKKNVWYLKSPYKCESCIYGFRSEAQYKKHLLNNHSAEAGELVCDICDTRASSKRFFERHMRAHRERYECNVCGKQFARIHTMRQHHVKLHKSRKCKHCNEEFHDLSKLLQHRKLLHLDFQCDKCGKKTSSRHMFRKHLRTHESYPCASCEETFANKKSLERHERDGHEARPSDAYCVECDKQFTSRRLYLHHVKKKHSPSSTRVRCPACEKQFSRKVYMRNHYNLTHLKKTNYYCNICDKYICRKDGLQKHMEFVHEGKRMPKNKMCDICGRGFSTNRTLTNHRRTHTGERPHRCDYCSAAFAQVTALKTHIKHIHLQIKRNRPRGDAAPPAPRPSGPPTTDKRTI